MSSASLLDKAYNVIIKRMVKTGQAPHYTEIAAETNGVGDQWKVSVLPNMLPASSAWPCRR